MESDCRAPRKCTAWQAIEKIRQHRPWPWSVNTSSRCHPERELLVIGLVLGLSYAGRTSIGIRFCRKTPKGKLWWILVGRSRYQICVTFRLKAACVCWRPDQQSESCKVAGGQKRFQHLPPLQSSALHIAWRDVCLEKYTLDQLLWWETLPTWSSTPPCNIYNNIIITETSAWHIHSRHSHNEETLQVEPRLQEGSLSQS